MNDKQIISSLRSWTPTPAACRAAITRLEDQADEIVRLRAEVERLQGRVTNATESARAEHEKRRKVAAHLDRLLLAVPRLVKAGMGLDDFREALAAWAELRAEMEGERDE